MATLNYVYFVQSGAEVCNLKMYKNAFSCKVYKLNQKQRNHDDSFELPNGMVLTTMPGFDTTTVMYDMIFKTYYVSTN